MPRVSIGPAFTAPEGTRAPVGLFVGGVMVPGVKMLVADGGDVLVVLDREKVRIDPAVTVEAPIGAFPTDGAA